jgi:hypothetical protein
MNTKHKGDQPPRDSTSKSALGRRKAEEAHQATVKQEDAQAPNDLVVMKAITT